MDAKVRSRDIMIKSAIMNQADRDSSERRVKSPNLIPLYLARTLAAWGDRTWQFVGGMFMLRFAFNQMIHHSFVTFLRLGSHHDNVNNEGDSSLQLVGIYGLVSCLSVLVSGSAIGRVVDNTARNRFYIKIHCFIFYLSCECFRLVTIAILTQNISIIFACVIMAVHFSVREFSFSHFI